LVLLILQAREKKGQTGGIGCERHSQVLKYPFMSVSYAWKRFWCSRGKVINLSDGGFLADPESDYGRFLNSELVPFETLAQKPCLALLGEPGIGKTWALKPEKLDSASSVAGTEHDSFWLDLRSYSTEGRLYTALFENNQIARWRKGNHILHLYLDSLDECLLRIDNVAALIADQLPSEPTDRLRIRFACRTAQWPQLLENALSQIFGDGFEAFELAPLRRCDVEHALRQRSVTNPKSFFAGIDALDVSSFAIKPVTLEFLISTFLRDGSLPSNQIELYEKGCRILCEESNESRRASGHRGTLSPEDRLIVASRIAAVTQFCNRFAVWTESEATLPSEDVHINELTGTEPNNFSMQMNISPESIREILDTGLFSSRGQGQIGWAHQTYAEFLAARYCTQHQMSVAQIQSLIFHPEQGGEHLVPQLYGVAAWLSVMNPNLLDIVARADPESLLGVAGSSLSEKQRQLVIQSILDETERGKLLSLRWKLFSLYPKLTHSKIAAQLRPYLLHPAKAVNTKQVVIDIARACGVSELGPELADIALKSQVRELRVPAGATAAIVGSNEVKSRLRPFAFEQQLDNDPDDEIKGIGLTAMWPGLISAAELFPLLTRPKKINFHGQYSSFLYSLSKKLDSGDLAEALEWFSKQPRRDIGPIEHLMDDIIELSFTNAEAPGVIDGLVKAVTSRVKLQDDLISRSDRAKLATLHTNHKLRQTLIGRALIELSEEELYFLQYCGLPLVRQFDFPWLLDRLNVASSESIRRSEIKLICQTIDPNQMELLWKSCQVHADLNAACREAFYILTDSPTAQILRDDFQRQARKETLLDPPPETRIEQALSNFEAGSVKAWIQLIQDLTLTPTSTRVGDLNNLNLTSLPGWKSATKKVRARIVAAAVVYVNNGEPENEKWFGTSQTYFSAISGLQALALLLIHDAQQLESIAASPWSKWVPIIIAYPFGDSQQVAIRHELLKMALDRVSDETAKRLTQLVTLENDNQGYLFISREIDICWTEQLAAALLKKLREGPLKPPVFKTILHTLLQRGSTGSRELANSYIVLPPPPHDDPQWPLMLSAIEALLSATKDAGWNDVWPVIRDYPECGHSIIESVSYPGGGYHEFVEKVSEAELGDLYTWLLINYPPSSNDHHASGALAPSQTAVMFRDQVLEHLKKRGTFAACDSIRDVMAKLPKYRWLGLHLEQAELFARAATWQAISPKQLLALAANPQQRFIESSGQLLAVVLESLDRLQSKLKGELPAAMDLWNVERGSYWPKDEEHLSDYVARHLDADIQHRGIVVNREVQIRKSVGKGTGQSTDIHVDALIPGASRDTYSRLYVIIEVKGNWNKELFENMETQLRNRYLKDNRCQAGIYLIGWFNCVQWKSDDSRRNECSSMNVTEAKNRFSDQALSLSTDGLEIKSCVLDISLRSE
jgi:hypothetical protein